MVCGVCLCDATVTNQSSRALQDKLILYIFQLCCGSEWIHITWRNHLGVTQWSRQKKSESAQTGRRWAKCDTFNYSLRRYLEQQLRIGKNAAWHMALVKKNRFDFWMNSTSFLWSRVLVMSLHACLQRSLHFRHQASTNRSRYELRRQGWEHEHFLKIYIPKSLH